MDQDRRKLLKAALALPVAVKLMNSASLAGVSDSRNMTLPGCRLVAVGESFITPELATIYATPGFPGVEDKPAFTAASRRLAGSPFLRQLEDIGNKRIRYMDACGMERQILTLLTPGVQPFSAATGVTLARSSNDQLALACHRHPDKFAGLAVLAIKAPRAAALELERGVNTLGLRGGVINPGQDTNLDHPSCRVIFAAAEALQVPLYLAPVPPPIPMAHPFLACGPAGPLGGYASTVYLHLLAIIKSGTFDRYPGLRIIAGHVGDGFGNWLSRVAAIQNHGINTGMESRYAGIKLQRSMTAYMQQHVYITSSGMSGNLAISRAQTALGSDRVLFAKEDPYGTNGRLNMTPPAMTALDTVNHDKLYRDNARKLFAI